MLTEEGAAVTGEGAPRCAAPAPRPTNSGWKLSEVVLLLVLAAVQFTQIIDFVIIMPLGPMIKPALQLSNRQFAAMVSAYAFSAGLTSLLAARFLDRFDRKRSLLVLYGGFAAGTLLCAFAPNYPVLMAGRAVAGGFAGVVGANVLAIVGDVFPYARRATAMGVIMSSFSVASIVGIPAGILLANLSHNWQTPFTVLGVLCVPAMLLAWRVLPPLRGHLGRHPHAPGLREVLLHPNHLRAYALMSALVLGSFTIIPFLSIYLVNNVGRSMSELPWVWVCGGVASLLTTTPVGFLADRWGKLPVFRVFALLCLAPVLLLTNLPPTSLAVTLLVTTLFMVCTSGRMVPAMAMITASTTPRQRGSFMSVNAAVQYLVMALAPVVAGLLLGAEPEGGPAPPQGAAAVAPADGGGGDPVEKKGPPLEGYPIVGLVSAASMMASVLLAGRLRRAAGSEGRPSQETVAEPVVS